MQVRYLTNDLEPAWTDYVASQAAGSVYHSLAWRNVVLRTYGHTPHYLIAVDEAGQAQGLLPMFEISRPFFGPVLASDPFTSYGGVIARDDATALELMRAAGDIGERIGARYVEIKNGTIWSVPPNGRWDVRTDLCSLEIALPGTADDFWKSWGSRNRNHIKRALNKEGLRVSHGGALLDDFYHLVVADMRRLGTPVHSRSFYQAMLQEYGDNADIWVAYAGNEPAGALLALRDDHTVSVLAGVRNPALAQSNAIRLLYWNVIEAHCGKVKMLDLGRSARGSGTYSFKVEMGGVEKSLAYVYRLTKADSIPLLDQHNPSMQRYIRAWQKLPLFVTRALGPLLIRHVP